MRLLISGSQTNKNTIGAFIVNNLDSTVTYEILKYPDQFSALLNSKFNRLINRFFPSLLVRKMDKIFLQQVYSFKPDIVLIFKGMEISSWSLKQISKMGIKLVNYNFDHPFEFFSRGTGNRFVKQAIPYYDLHISYSSVIVEQLQQRYNINAAWIPFGFHLTEQQYQEVIRRNNPEINRVCFVGNPDEWRVAVIKRLVKEQIPIDLYGFGWEKRFQSSDFLKIHMPRQGGSFWRDPVEFWQVLRQYRIQLNFFRPHNEGSHNLRTFEVPAVGGILLTPVSKEQREFFEENNEIFFYTDVDDLIGKCKWLTGREQPWIDNIRDKTRMKSVSADYSYKRRTRDLVKLLAKEIGVS